MGIDGIYALLKLKILGICLQGLDVRVRRISLYNTILFQNRNRNRSLLIQNGKSECIIEFIMQVIYHFSE